MKSFFEFFARRHNLANLITLMTILLGLNSFLKIQRDVWPMVDYGVMIITTRYPGASPEDVELNVTNEIENELKRVTGIEKMTSVSMENISVVTVVIDMDAKDQEKIKREIRDAVTRVTDFPFEVDELPLVTEVDTSIFPVIEVGLSGEIPYSELRTYAKRFKKKLEALPGISRVDEYGYLAREVKVDVSPEAIRKYHVPMRDVIQAIRSRNIRSTGGSFESYTSEKNLVTLAQFKTPEEVGDVVVRSSFEGVLIKVKDLAVIHDDFEDQRVFSSINGRKAISFQILKKENADVIRTVDSVRELVAKESQNLPKALEFQYSNDFSRYVRNRLNVVFSNGIIGLILVVLVLTFFLNLRSAFWVSMGIPVTLLGVVFMMPFFDASLDSITLAAIIIVIGIIVDDGIIIAENIQKYREQGLPLVEAAVTGIHEVFPPVLTTILTTFLAFAPMFLMTGIFGSFVFVIPLVISLALFISLFEAIMVLPAHLTMIWPWNRGRQEKLPQKNWFAVVAGPFSVYLKKVLRFRYVFIILSVILLSSSIWYASKYMKFSLFPSSMAEMFYILVELPTGTSLKATSDKISDIERLVEKMPKEELESFVTRIGTLEVFPAAGFPPGENENWGYVMVSLTPYTKRSRTADEIVEALRSETDKIAGIDRIVYSIDGGGPPIGKPITIRIVGDDDVQRSQLTKQVEEFLATIPGVKDINREDKRGKDQVELKVNYDKLAKLDLTVEDIARNVRVAYDGEVVTSVRYGDEDVDFRVQLNEKVRSNPSHLSELLIPNKKGHLVALRNVAKFETGPGPSNFFHYDRQRAVTVTADILQNETDPLAATQQVLDHFDLDKDWPGMRFVVGGEAEESRESMISLLRAFILAVLGIYFLLILLFNSFTQPLIVLASIPFGLMGVIITFALHKEDLGFVAMMGVIGLAGVVVNDSLVLVNHINRLRKDHPEQDLLSLVVQGTSDRLRAVVLTTLTTVVGLLPLAYGIGGSDPYMAPMALALAYGLIFATPLTLMLVPSIYLVGDDFLKRVGKL